MLEQPPRRQQPAGPPALRVANFTDLAVDGQTVLGLGGREAPEIVAELRRYADLPVFCVVSGSQGTLLADVLARLRAIRSPCYPHAAFVLGGIVRLPEEPEVEIFQVAEAGTLGARIDGFARSRLAFDKSRLHLVNPSPLPQRVDVLVVGAGVTGLYAASRLREHGLSVCLVEKEDCVGGIWARYANASSKVNTSEAAYRLREPACRANRDHSTTAEILADVHYLARGLDGQLFTGARADRIQRSEGGYRTEIVRNGQAAQLDSRGILLAINDRVGSPRQIAWENQGSFRGALVNGLGDDTAGLDWRGREVVIVGMGAFAVENARTALEAGARRVTVVCRRHGTVCPKIIDYLNFCAPYDDAFQHDRRSNIRNMMLWKKLYDLSKAAQPECWMQKIKHDGHTISVSDIWFIAHHLGLLRTVRGSVSGLFPEGVIAGGQRLPADILVNCVGFQRNAPAAAALSGASQVYNHNYIDRDFMYLADAYIDENAHNSFFGSSVLEMVKFYVEVYLRLFASPSFERLLQAEGIQRIPIQERKWSHYIAGAAALIRADPRFLELARDQVARRTASFLQAHDLPTYLAENKREWLDTHRLLAGRRLAEEECLPFVFDRLLEPKAG